VSGLLVTLLLIGMGAWLAVALLGALLIGRGIRIADRRNDESPDPLPPGPGSGAAGATCSCRCRWIRSRSHRC